MLNNTIMEFKGFKASIMEAQRLTGDQTHGLPPGTALPVYYSDAFLKYPEKWMKGPGVFVVPVKPDKGLWFDWTDNDSLNTLILPTVKGCNPITGMQTSGFFLERYDEKCPKHGCNFEADRYCPECDYKWAPQNYVCAPNTLWWDGFRAEDGTVRQFFFTEEMMRDIATAMIGKENTVPAFGFAFYSPKVRREPPKTVLRETSSVLFSSPVPVNYKYLNSTNYSYPSDTLGGGLKSINFNTTRGSSAGGIKKSLLPESLLCVNNDVAHDGNESRDISLASPTDLNPVDDNSYGVDEEQTASVFHVASTDFVPDKEVSVGAGAKIRQSLKQDSYSLDSWKDKPDAVMTIYFVFQSEFEKMAAGGIKDVEGKKEGMLDGLTIG